MKTSNYLDISQGSNATITRKDRVKLSIPAYHRAHNHQHALLRPDPLHMRLCCRPPVRAGTFTELEKIE